MKKRAVAPGRSRTVRVDPEVYRALRGLAADKHTINTVVQRFVRDALRKSKPTH